VLLFDGSDLASALDRSLVLEAMGIAHAVEPTGEGTYALDVDEADAAAARAALAAWEAENATPQRLDAAEYGATRAGLAAAMALLAFGGVVGLLPGADWAARGSADAARIVGGAWWRAATALTLHADAAHLLGNAAALAVFLGALAQRRGPALAAWLTLVAGVAGNVAVAALVRGGHVSVGASTAVFGALGALSALEVPRRRAWMTLAMGAALLGILGTGARADLLAHLAGFAAGAAGGASLRRARPPRRSPWQPALALAAAAPLALAWWRALR